MSQVNHFILDPLFGALWLSVSLCVLFYIYTYIAVKKTKQNNKTPQLFAVCLNLQGLIQLYICHLPLLFCFLSSQT